VEALWSYVTDHHSQLIFDSYQHVSAVVQSVLLATIIGVAVGVLTYRNRVASDLATATSSVILTVPAFALLGLLIPLFGLGVIPSVTALVLYSLLPIIRNTIVGLNAVDPALIDAARGIGMGRLDTLGRVELPSGVAIDPLGHATQHPDVDGRAGDRGLRQGAWPRQPHLCRAGASR
jgi:osmoprotectant transport system permease protein